MLSGKFAADFTDKLFSKCYLLLHMYADLIHLKLLGNRTSLSCMARRTGTFLQKVLVSGLYYVFL